MKESRSRWNRFVCICDIIRYLIHDIIDLLIGCFWFAHEIVFDQEDSITREKFVIKIRQ